MKDIKKSFCSNADTLLITSAECDGTMEHLTELTAIALQDFPGLVSNQIRPYSCRGGAGPGHKMYGVEFSANVAFKASGRNTRKYDVVASIDENDFVTCR